MSPIEPVRKHSLMRALRASLDGLAFAFASERAFRLEVFVLCAAILVACLAEPDLFRRGALIGAVLLVLGVELLNTAIEKFCDRTHPEIDPAIKAIKDMGSAAVFCAICCAGLLWLAAAASWLR